MIIKNNGFVNEVVELANIYTVHGLFEHPTIYNYRVFFEFIKKEKSKDGKKLHSHFAWWDVLDSLGENDYLNLIKTYYKDNVHNKKTFV